MTILQTDPKDRSSESIPPWARKGVVGIDVDVVVDDDVVVTRDHDERKWNFAPSDQTSLDSFALDWVQMLRWVRASGSKTDLSTRMRKEKERASN